MNFKNIKDINGNCFDFKIVDKQIQINKLNSKEEITLENVYVSNGWIDCHVHCDLKNDFLNSSPDEIGYKAGVTTVIDAGSVGLNNIDNLFLVRDKYKTNIKCLLNISKLGIPSQNELHDLNNIDIKFENKYKDFVVGYKARISSSVVGENGVKPLEVFVKQKKEKNISMPLMVHVGNEPPSFKEIGNYLSEGDVITHAYNGKNNSIFLSNGEPTETTKLLKNKRVLLDIGHGNDSFDSKLFTNVLTNDLSFKPDLISTDIYRKNIDNGKVVSLATTMSKVHSLGMSWNEVIDSVTIRPSKTFNLGNNISIENCGGNLTFFKIINVNEIETDSKNNEIQINEKIVPVAVLVNWEFYKIGEENGY